MAQDDPIAGAFDHLLGLLDEARERRGDQRDVQAVGRLHEAVADASREWSRLRKRAEGTLSTNWRLGSWLFSGALGLLLAGQLLAVLTNEPTPAPRNLASLALQGLGIGVLLWVCLRDRGGDRAAEPPRRVAMLALLGIVGLATLARTLWLSELPWL